MVWGVCVVWAGCICHGSHDLPLQSMVSRMDGVRGGCTELSTASTTST